MRTLKRSALVAAGAALLAAGAAGLASGGEQATRAPVIKQRDARFGPILATRGHKALYYWNVEKRDFRVQRQPDKAKPPRPAELPRARPRDRHRGRNVVEIDDALP